jgi:hypothetical protein
MRKKCKTIRLVEDFHSRSIDVRELHYARLLGEQPVTIPSAHHPWLFRLETDRYSVRIRFTPDSDWFGVRLQWIHSPLRRGRRMNWNRSRPLFLCRFCRRRSQKLYAGKDFVACRKCCKLRYVSQTLGPKAKIHRQALKIRLRLGGKPFIGASFPKRPDGMQKRIYNRMRARAEWLERRLLTGRYRKYWSWRKPEYPILIKIPRI